MWRLSFAARAGTTLDLLKFPIVNPTPYRMFRRHERLQECRREMEDDPSPQRPKDLRRQGYLVGKGGGGGRGRGGRHSRGTDPNPPVFLCPGRVGQTFLPKAGRGTIAFDPDALAFGEYDARERGSAGG